MSPDDRASSYWMEFFLGDRSDLELVARNLYANLRRLDAAAHDLIVIEPPAPPVSVERSTTGSPERRQGS